MSPEPTPSQTIGPFFHDALLDRDRSQLVPPDHPGAIKIEGAVYDGAGDPVPDAMVEVWQADANGRYDDRAGLAPDENFYGFGRAGTDEDGRFSFFTVRPGPVHGPDGETQAPHLLVSVFARGLLKQLVTRIYFPEEAEANATDPVLRSVEDPKERDTLISRHAGKGTYRFDVRLQGENQTAFFEFGE